MTAFRKRRLGKHAKHHWHRELAPVARSVVHVLLKAAPLAGVARQHRVTALANVGELWHSWPQLIEDEVIDRLEYPVWSSPVAASAGDPISW